MVQAQGAEGENTFLIRKQTMIVKNTKTIDEVYRRDAKVSISLMHFFGDQKFAILQSNDPTILIILFPCTAIG